MQKCFFCDEKEKFSRKNGSGYTFSSGTGLREHLAAGAAGGGPGDPGGLPGGSLPHRDPLGPHHHGPV